jgi:hypothetical protein
MSGSLKERGGRGESCPPLNQDRCGHRPRSDPTGAERQKRPKTGAQRVADCRRRNRPKLGQWKLELPEYETAQALYLSGNLDDERDMEDAEKCKAALQSVVLSWISEVIAIKKVTTLVCDRFRGAYL